MPSVMSSCWFVSSSRECQCKMQSLYILYVCLFHKFCLSSCFKLQQGDCYSISMPRKEPKNQEARKYGFTPPCRSELQHFQEALLAGFRFSVYTMFLVLNPKMLLNRTGNQLWFLEASVTESAHQDKHNQGCADCEAPSVSQVAVPPEWRLRLSSAPLHKTESECAQKHMQKWICFNFSFSLGH